MEERDLKLFIRIPTLTTERLTLRRILPTDLDDVFAYASNPAVPKYLLWYPHPNKDYTARYLREVDRRYKKAQYYDWAITLTDSGKMIGTCGFTSFDLPNNSAEVGYVLSAPYWGQSIAPEALRAVITFGFEALELNRIEAHFIPDNHSSRRVLEKCMMRPEGVRREAMYVKGGYVDIETYAMTARDYKKITNR
jgi:ribosomal-protein-alanine N-acetyltransferase